MTEHFYGFSERAVDSLFLVFSLFLIQSLVLSLRQRLTAFKLSCSKNTFNEGSGNFIYSRHICFRQCFSPVFPIPPILQNRCSDFAEIAEKHLCRCFF